MSISLYKKITSTRNLFQAWKEFRKGKGNKKDVLQFEYHLEQNIFQLHRDLRDNKYQHGPYKSFYITDPKRRHIHKAIVRDRVVHHAIYKTFYPIFNPTFIATSFSCRFGKGTHKGVLWLAKSVRKVSKNYTRPCFILKCDIRRFFDSVDHNVLIAILNKKIRDKETRHLLDEVVSGFSSGSSNLFEKVGLPIGNLTSQLFANIYMDKFDQFIKQGLKVKYYARYTDDFVIVSEDEEYLKDILKPVADFLDVELKLSLHPHKVSIQKLHNGIDYLGYIILPHYILLRTKTKNRIYRGLSRKVREYKGGKIDKEVAEQSLHSYLGTLSHADAHKISEDLKNTFWFEIND